MLPDKLIELLKALFTEILQDDTAVQNQLNGFNNTFSVLFFSDIANTLTKEQQAEFSGKISDLKTKEDYHTAFNSTLKKYLSDQQIREIYEKRLKKFVNQTLKPLFQEFTPDQKKQFQEIADKYLSTSA